MFDKSRVLLLLRNNYFLISIILIFAVFLSYQIIHENLYLADSHEYLKEAENIKSNGVFYCGNQNETINNDFYTKRPPIYPLFIALLSLLSKSPIVIIILQSILSILSVLIIRKAFLQIGYPKSYDPLFLILLILSPAQMVYANLVMAETLFQLTLALAFYTLTQYITKNSIKYLLIFNILLAISALVKPVMYLFVYPSFFMMIYFSTRNRSLKPLLLGIIPIVLIQLYSFWNFKRTDYWHFSSIQTINLVQYNTYYFNVQRVGAEKADLILDNQIAKANDIESYPAKQKFLNRTSKQIISRNFWNYSWFHFKGMIRLFFDPGRFDLSNFLGIEETGSVGFLNHLNHNGIKGAINYLMQQNTPLIITLLIIGLANILKVVGLIYFSFKKTIDFRFRLILITLIVYFAFTAGPIGASRLLMPLIPFIILATLTGFNSILYLKRVLPQTN